MSDFFTYTKCNDWDGDEDTNKIEIEDEQCSTCLDWIIYDWQVIRSFTRHNDTSKSICIDCVTKAGESK